MDWLKLIKSFYPRYWTKGQVWDAVQMGKITESQYEEIVGESFPAERPE